MYQKVICSVIRHDSIFWWELRNIFCSYELRPLWCFSAPALRTTKDFNVPTFQLHQKVKSKKENIGKTDHIFLYIFLLFWWHFLNIQYRFFRVFSSISCHSRSRTIFDIPLKRLIIKFFQVSSLKTKEVVPLLTAVGWKFYYRQFRQF